MQAASTWPVRQIVHALMSLERVFPIYNRVNCNECSNENKGILAENIVFNKIINLVQL